MKFFTFTLLCILVVDAEKKDKKRTHEATPGTTPRKTNFKELPDFDEYQPDENEYDPHKYADGDEACDAWYHPWFMKNSNEHQFRATMLNQRWAIESCCAREIVVWRVCEVNCRQTRRDWDSTAQRAVPHDPGYRKAKYPIYMHYNEGVDFLETKKLPSYYSGSRPTDQTQKCVRTRIDSLRAIEVKPQRPRCIESRTAAAGANAIRITLKPSISRSATERSDAETGNQRRAPGPGITGADVLSMSMRSSGDPWQTMPVKRRRIEEESEESFDSVSSQMQFKICIETLGGEDLELRMSMSS